MNVKPFDTLRARVGMACDKMAHRGRWSAAYDVMKRFETWWERTSDTTRYDSEPGTVPNVEEAIL